MPGTLLLLLPAEGVGGCEHRRNGATDSGARCQHSYDLNQIPYDYTMEVRNRFKELHLIDRVPEELWTEIRDIIKEAVIKTIPHHQWE